ncbi:hypothetical protein ABMC88_11250 [Sulfitobacter sp. HNIBRBA2951]|uniref:hypothetical protein n=1 Tax=Sulfitobacter aquimarinus TaxID=3158557 RepID=UPI0032DFAE0C
MSAPDTNIEKQEAEHRPSLVGIRGALAFGALMMVLLGFYSLFNGDDASAYSDDGEAPSETAPIAADVYVPGTNDSATPTATD